MSSAPVRGIVPHRQRRHHHHHHHHEKHQRRHCSDNNQNQANSQSSIQEPIQNIDNPKKVEIEEKRPKVNPIFLWAAQREQRIVEVRCEDYDKRNRIKLTKTAQGWRSIPRTALTAYPIIGPVTEEEAEQQETLSTTSKNEEKENTSRGRPEIKQVGVDELEDTRVNDASRLGKVDETEEEKERRKHKRKKHSDLSKNKKRKSDFETEEIPNETLITTNWKMKKRRRVDKNKKRKKICLEENVIERDINITNEIKIKEESKKDDVTITKLKDVEEISETNNKDYKIPIKNSEKIITPDDDSKKCHDLEKLQKNRYLQPRVVLEQLHLSKLPAKVHRRLVDKELENNLEENEGNNENSVSKIIESNVENNNLNDNESQIPVVNEEAIVDKEDLEEILNMLDSNHFPININESKSNLSESKNLTRSCTKLDAVLVNKDEKEDNRINSPLTELKDCAKKECDLTAAEKRNKFGERNSIKHRVGSKSLDETIERLERSINYQKKMNSVPNILEITEDEKSKEKIDKTESKSTNNNCDQENVTAPRSPISATDENSQDKKEMEKDILESSKILDALRNTPGLSVSLAINGKKHTTIIDANSVEQKASPTSRSPDSQTEACDKIEKLIPAIPLAKNIYDNRSKTESPSAKSRVESPESTVNFPKHERYPFEADSHNDNEENDCDSQVVEETPIQNRFKSHVDKDICQNPEEYQNYFENESKNYSVDSTKIPNLKPLPQVVSRNSEAQAKYSNLSRYQESDNFDEQLTEEFHSQVSPQPSGIPYSMSSSRRSSIAYLERLLPSPPCSVSCSEDARNDLTLKGILSSPNNVDARNFDKNEYAADLSSHCDSDLSPSYNHSEERFLKESFYNDKAIINQRSQKLSQENMKYLEMKNHGRPMSSGDVHNPFVSDYVSPKRPLSAEWTINQQRMQYNNGCYSNNIHYANQKEFITRPKIQETYVSPTIFLDPASQLRELIKTSGHLIPDPLLVPRDYLPLLAGAPLTEIPKLLATRPELRLPEALTRPELLRDPDLLVISIAHLQHVLDHGEGPANQVYQSNQRMLNPMNECKNVRQTQEEKRELQRPKLSCKPIGKLMPAPIDLSNNHKLNSHPPLLRVRSGLLKQEPEVSSTASSPDDSQLWHPLFGSQKQRQQHHQQQQQQSHQASWHRTTLAS